MEKKAKIMDSAIKLFSEKGYLATSIQDIASDCKISKGSFYKFFDSKEDLFIQVLDYNLQKMMVEAGKVDLLKSLSPRDKLIKKIQIEMENFLENQVFIKMLTTDLPIKESKEVFYSRVKRRLMNWHKDCLVQAYGSNIQPYIWDYVVILEGMMKEYLDLLIFGQKNFSIKVAVDFIVDRLDALVEAGCSVKPVLTPDMMREYEEAESVFVSREEQLNALLDQLGERIAMGEMPDSERKKFISAAQLLAEEIRKENARDFLIDALMSYIKKNKDLEESVSLIQDFLNRNEKDGERNHG
ncbi:TetR/AcrR family transcriptional regulator [Polycladomyces sp. WAk]|uniref:TetR/AcrR family transcriptional regulator n=1 Tax=Polycladomyces zharkentensis TaxID=2807616 RepID=A0ABS2WLD7_9BACL|nr:TetR/AcrR family transcriptional regulator [Polycladomyces sp. WAk]MBN2910298.1 TetR/AcrR family transcriptional regulator [Polycladomyces sp. WAk]